MVIPQVPVTGLAANFSPIPRIAPPTFGQRDTRCGNANEVDRFTPGSLLELATPFELVSELTTTILSNVHNK